MSPWRTSLLMTVSAMVLLAVGAILLNGAGAQPRADLAGYAGSAAAGERTAYLEGTPAMATPAMLTIQQGDPRSATNNDVVAWITIDKSPLTLL